MFSFKWLQNGMTERYIMAYSYFVFFSKWDVWYLTSGCFDIVLEICCGTMPYHDEEYPGQPLWQSVLLFCCKGMIEGIMVVLFFWLLVQVLFTKQLEIHLQVLLLVGLVIFCLCLLLGCFICWRKSHFYPSEDKEAGTSRPTPSDPVNFSSSPPVAPLPPSPAVTENSRQLYEELDGDILEYPSTFTSPAPSEREFKEHPRTYFSLRRLSTPQLSSPTYKPLNSSHTSLPVFPKFLSKTCRAVQRRCTVTGAGIYNEHSRLTSPGSVSSSMPEEPIPLSPLTYGSLSPKPCLHFTIAFSMEQQALIAHILRVTGTSHKLEDISIHGSLPPLYPFPIQASTQSNLSLEPHTLMLLLKVNSVKELKQCVLRIVVNIRDISTEGSTVLGELEVECGGREWRNDQLFYLTKELNQSKLKTAIPT